jgi:hypothetical protein
MIIKDVIGLSEQEAHELCAHAGYKTRIRSKDGVSIMGTCDFRRDRVNLVIENDKVIGASIG